jgi:hypothetical protein
MNSGGLTNSKRIKLSTSDASVGPMMNTTKPIMKGEMKMYGSTSRHLGRKRGMKLVFQPNRDRERSDESLAW